MEKFKNTSSFIQAAILPDCWSSAICNKAKKKNVGDYCRASSTSNAIPIFTSDIPFKPTLLKAQKSSSFVKKKKKKKKCITS